MSEHLRAVAGPAAGVKHAPASRERSRDGVPGPMLRIDEQALLRDVQAEGERLWTAIPQWHWTARPLDEIAPPSYPVRGEH